MFEEFNASKSTVEKLRLAFWPWSAKLAPKLRHRPITNRVKQKRGFLMPHSQPDLVWRQIIWPNPFSADDATELVRRLAADAFRGLVTFEAIGQEGSVSHFYATTPDHIRALTQTIEMVNGTVTIDSDARTEVDSNVRLTLAGATVPLLDRRPRETNRQLLAALAAASFRDEQVVLRVTLGARVHPRLAPPKPADPSQSWPSLLLEGVRPASGEVANRVRAKAQEVGMLATITTGVEAKSEGRRRTILSGVLAALRTAESAGTRMNFARVTGKTNVASSRGRIALTASEAASLLAWPLSVDDADLPGMPPAHPRLLSLTAKNIETRRIFAETIGPGKPRPLGISIEDARVHLHVMAPTNSGKSSLFLNLATRDMIEGRSLFLIDAKGDLVNDVLERVPEHRRNDVVVIDPTDETRPVGINPFASPGTRPELVADSMLSVLRNLFPSAFGPRTSDAVHASLLTLANTPGATLTWLPRLFNDDAFRRRILQSVPDEGLAEFWSYYEGLSDGARSQMVGPVLSRLRQFLLRPSLRRTLDQSNPKFTLGSLFTSPRIVLVSLNAGLLGESSRLLGSLLVAELQELTLARAAVPQAKRTPVSIYVDEAQEFVRTSGEALGSALEVARSLGAAWHIAHQHAAQMPREVMASIQANCLNRVYFRLQGDDARTVANTTSQLTADDFTALPRFGVYCSLVRNGESLGWVRGRTLEPPTPVARAAHLRQLSAERWGRDPDDPNEPVIPTADAPAIGRRKRATS